MAGCSFLMLEGVDGVRGNALRCSPGAGEALRCLLLRTAEKALRCFPLTRFMLLQQKNLPPGGFSELCESGDS